MNPPEQPSLGSSNLPPPGGFTIQPARKVSMGIFLLSALAGVLVVGGGAFAYYHYSQSPDAIVQKMFARLAEVTSVEYAGTIRAASLDAWEGAELILPVTTGGEKPSVVVNFSGASNLQNLSDAQGSLLLNITLNADGKDVRLGLELRSVAQTIFVKLSNTQTGGLIDLGPLAGKWIKIDLAALQSQFGGKAPEESTAEAGLSAEKAQEIRDIFRRSRIFSITGTLSDAATGEPDMHHFKFTLKKQGVKELFIDILKVAEERLPTTEELAEFERQTAGTSWPEGEIWIGKEDLLPHKISLYVPVQKEGTGTEADQMETTLSFKNFNAPVQVEIPANSVPFEQILGSLFAGFESGPDVRKGPGTK